MIGLMISHYSLGLLERLKALQGYSMSRTERLRKEALDSYKKAFDTKETISEYESKGIEKMSKKEAMMIAIDLIPRAVLRSKRV